MLLNKKVIIFDLGGVLLDLNIEKSFAAFVGMGVDAAMLTERNCLMNDMMQKYDRGDISTKEFFDYIATCLSPQCRELPADVLNEKIQNAWNMMLGDFPLHKLQRIMRLRNAGYRIVMLSNTNEGHWDTIEEKFSRAAGSPLHSVFHSLYLSYRMRRRKPEPEIFLELLEQENAAPHEALFIDDSYENCQAAAALGIESVQVERNASWDENFLADKWR